MKTVLLPVAGDPTVSFSFTFAVGSQNDPPGREGLAALTAAMLVEGATERHSYDEILARLYPLATGYDVTADKELTTIDGRVHRDRLDEFTALLLDAVLRPAFREEDFERLRSDAINHIANTLRYSSDEELGKAALTAAIFAGTPYAHPVEGTVSGLTAIGLVDVRRCYAQYYRRDALTLGLAGGYEMTLLTTLEQALAMMPGAGPAATVPAAPGTPETLTAPGTPATPTAPVIRVPAAAGRRVVLVDKPGADASISFGFPLAVARGERDFYALWIANSWLGEHRHGASHLYQVIREARGLNYGNYSYIEAFPDGGALQMPPVNVARRQQLFEVWLRTLPNEQAMFALRAALSELDRLIADGMTAAQFELTRSFLGKYSTHYAPTTADRLGYAVDDTFYGIGGDGHLARFRAMMAELTRAEVNAAIRTHLQTANLTIAIVTGAAAGLAAQLASGEPTPIAYPNPMPDEILREDERIAAYELGIAADAIECRPVGELFA
jgi:zinc protease